VVNTADRCPTTPAGDRVDSVGCSLTVRLEVFFDTNSANIKPESYPDLDRVVSFMSTAVTSATGVIEGHTDSVGNDAYNQSLSQRRADAVRKYLLDKGVAAARLESKGFGESQPVADNATAEGRAQNRRVILRRTDVK
jgi:OmpA-OmpF porin, OOP family